MDKILINKTIDNVKEYLPEFHKDKRANLVQLDVFLKKKYNAKKADWKDIDICTKTKVKRINKYCNTVFCVSEGLVDDKDYFCSYIIERKNCINPSVDKDDFFYDLFLIVGSKDGVTPSSYFVGGNSKGILEELHVFCYKY